MTTEYTNNDDQLPIHPQKQEDSFAGDHDSSDEEEEVEPNPFTKEDALRLIDIDQISFTIPDTFTSIVDGDWEDGVFSPFKSLQTVIIPESITYIGSYSFEKCSALQDINLPDSITSIGEGSFYDCSALKNIKLPPSITSIDVGTFDSCSSLSSSPSQILSL